MLEALYNTQARSNRQSNPGSSYQSVCFTVDFPEVFRAVYMVAYAKQIQLGHGVSS